MVASDVEFCATDVLYSRPVVPSTPKKRKLSDAAHPPSTPPSARSAKSDSPYRKRAGGSASVVKAMPTLEPRVCIGLSYSVLILLLT